MRICYLRISISFLLLFIFSLNLNGLRSLILFCQLFLFYYCKFSLGHFSLLLIFVFSLDLNCSGCMILFSFLLPLLKLPFFFLLIILSLCLDSLSGLILFLFLSFFFSCERFYFLILLIFKHLLSV